MEMIQEQQDHFCAYGRVCVPYQQGPLYPLFSLYENKNLLFNLIQFYLNKHKSSCCTKTSQCFNGRAI